MTPGALAAQHIVAQIPCSAAKCRALFSPDGLGRDCYMI
jgi:hypothetical protein